ncbi:hypothetical protein Salmuc_01748 [Salipiger mucosus DSM 16094]|uniref:Uncharacterized protein n=1 Tax=Salipiger mucosus DSM 16094 TaxID=1123237 RepID=S9QWI3_9RHOB|nr:hypothetical protein Salmuc_01748 [Salipiger mucosus DSM 16094]
MDVCETMIEIGRLMAEADWVLQSGGAERADEAFEKGCDLAGGQKRIFLHKEGARGNRSPHFNIPAEYFSIASRYRRNWDKFSENSQRLLARNVLQVLGYPGDDVGHPPDDPVKAIICYTEGGKLKGGTSLALQLAKDTLGDAVDIVNLGHPDYRNATAQEVVDQVLGRGHIPPAQMTLF